MPGKVRICVRVGYPKLQLRGEKVEKVPVWMMRQAGWILPGRVRVCVRVGYPRWQGVGEKVER